MRKINLSETHAKQSLDKTLIYEVIGVTAPVKETRFSIARIVIPPNTTGFKHFHRISEEAYLVTSGSATLNVDDTSYRMLPGDVFLITPEEKHQVMTGAGEEIEFLAITIPAYILGDYIQP